MAALCLSCAGIFVFSVRKMLLGPGVCPLCASAVLLLTVRFAAGCGGGSAEPAAPIPVAVPADFSQFSPPTPFWSLRAQPVPRSRFL